MFNTMMENDRKGKERERDRKEKGIEILAKLVFSFSIIVFNMMKLLVILFTMKLFAKLIYLIIKSTY